MMPEHISSATIMKRHYFNEYFKKATAERKGFLGQINRFFEDESAGAKLIVGGVAVGLPLSFLAPVLFPVYGQTLAVLGALGGSLVSVAAHIVVSRDANKAMEKDIASGTLAQRYAEEVLKPQWLDNGYKISALSSLPAKNTATEKFNTRVEGAGSVAMDVKSTAAASPQKPKFDA